ncbi:MAG TPA: sulfite oxidase-like oxidoreductase [Dehalococcoidia bacterium]|nr:sulfite oxidase-like oxidoreductase [Dehalococcoidia bacterium]
MSQTREPELRPDGKVRLPPGQHLTSGWPVLHYGSIPRIELESWKLHVWGLVDHERAFSWEEFAALGNVGQVNDIHCVTTWSKYDNEWTGIPFRALLDAINVRSEASHVMLHSYGGYTTNVPLVDLDRDDVMFAHRHNGEPLTGEHGWPLRLVIPHLYFWKSAKWVGGIQFLDQDQPGFWETFGYHMYGDPWKHQRYS